LCENKVKSHAQKVTSKENLFHFRLLHSLQKVYLNLFLKNCFKIYSSLSLHLHIFCFVFQCTESCENLNCGDGKRCIMKKGQPKCVCAPNCRVTATINNKNRKVGGTKRIAVIQLPEMKSANRHYSVVGLPTKNSEMQSDEPTLIVANNRRNLLLKLNQSSSEASSPNTVQSLIPSRASPNDNDTRIMMEMKFRSGFFNDNNNIKMTSYYDEFYFGNIVSIMCFKTKIKQKN
jgi:hypothetical protein